MKKIMLGIVMLLILGGGAYWYFVLRQNVSAPTTFSNVQKQLASGCGNTICEEGENFNSCPVDCYNPTSSGPELAKLALKPSDFPPPHQGTTPSEKTSWVQWAHDLVGESYVWPPLQNQGALAIYETITTLMGPGDLSWDRWGRLEQYILVFPTNKISKAFEDMNVENLSKLDVKDQVSFQELPDPAVGEKSKAFKMQSQDGRYSSYVIVFVKNNFLEYFIFSGEKYEYQVFPPLAREAAEKIQ
ncbi:MAG TPA: hypothetical protein VJC15_00610 [Candidatus Paceibacterota bacterium]